MRNARRTIVTLVIVIAAILAMSTTASAQVGYLMRLSAEFQWTPGLPSPEIGTDVAPLAAGAGGTVTYRKTIFIPYRSIYVMFSATGHTHNGAALLMACLIDGVPCTPGGGTTEGGPTGWITLQKMPAQPWITASNNCNDSGGGDGDCIDNNLVANWCIGLDPYSHVLPGFHTIELKLASSIAGENVYYERSHIYIDNLNSAQAVCKPSTFVPPPLPPPPPVHDN